MASYFSNSNCEGDLLMSSFPRDQKLVSHSQASSHAANVLMYLNQNSSASYSDGLSATSLLPHSHNYSQSDNGTRGPVGNSVIEDSSLLSRGLIHTDQNVQCHGLLLTLGSHMPCEISEPSFQSQYSYPAIASMLTNAKDFKSDEWMFLGFSGTSQNSIKPEASSDPNFLSSPSEKLFERLCANSILNSKYLRPAQRLLDEVVNVQSSLKQPGSGLNKNLHEMDYGSKDLDGRIHGRSLQTCSDSNVTIRNYSSSCELSPAERQDVLDKKTKLMSMLEEVGKKYREYCHQMQIMASSFDMFAGCGAAEAYTSLAFRTISQHFRCLRDAIVGQIQIIQRNLGEQEGIPRLRYVDQHLRQPRALQNLGLTRQAWRPQRGLPESCVSILRAWLFEHFLHPYPKDSEKIMLARQTGLSRNQVANWFINARVRLWKPMIEDMYKEEFGESDMSCNLSQVSSPAKDSRDDGQASKDGEKEHHDKFIGAVISQSQEDQRSNTDKNNLCSVENMPSDQIGDSSNILTATGATYDLSELGSLAMNDHVSLALELRNCESGGFRGSSGVNRKVDDTSLPATAETDLLDYHFMDPGKEQHKFANSHLLHEFVV